MAAPEVRNGMENMGKVYWEKGEKPYLSDSQL
jgi:hypothetical protein